MPFLHRLIHSLDNEGLYSLAIKTLRDRLLGRAPSPLDARPAGVHPFDLAHGTDTSGFIPGAELAGDQLTLGNSAYYITAYYAVAPSTLRQALAHLPIPAASLSAFTFVDLGCGKGRALLVAAEQPFGRLLGVDLSPQLCQIARTNTQSDSRITIRQQDATTLDYPNTGLVLFLYHPFLANILRKVLTNLEVQFHANPRPIFLLYANPTYARVIARYPYLQQVWDYGFDLSNEDAAADRHGMTRDHYTLYKARATQ